MLQFITLAIVVACAVQFPWGVSATRATPAPKVAIIGAGAAGSSAAFWISKAKERFGVSVDIDVYEKSNYVGGRSTVVHPYNNRAYRPVEVGASIFVTSNKNMYRAADEFGLTLGTDDTEGYAVGLWDGKEVLLNLGDSEEDFNTFVSRYGMQSLATTGALVQDVFDKYSNVYKPSTPHWNTISQVSNALGFAGLTAQTLADYYRANNVSEAFIYEMAEGATRINYGQNADAISALEGVAAQPNAYDTLHIRGGNFQVFEQFIQRSKARLYLNTVVKAVKPDRDSWTVITSAGSSKYKAVILAAPFHQTGIVVSPSVAASIPNTPYVHLHVTLFTTNDTTASSTFFDSSGLQGSPPPAKFMLTTWNGVRQGKLRDLKYNAISYHGNVTASGEEVVKIFSTKKVEDSDLRAMFNNVGWVYRKEWDAYPYLKPNNAYPPITLAKGFYYINAFEPFMSTMETETVASRQVVDIMLRDSFNGASICGPSPSQNTDPNFVYGWDC